MVVTFCCRKNLIRVKHILQGIFLTEKVFILYYYKLFVILTNCFEIEALYNVLWLSLL
jgi:hypothetical protein